MVPIHFAEHDVAGEDHHFGGGFAFVGDRERVAGFVEAQAADEPAAIEVLTVRHAGVEAVARQVVDFVDVDRARKNAAEESMRTAVHVAATELCDGCRLELPIVVQDFGNLHRW